jgi:hypothetical protein
MTNVQFYFALGLPMFTILVVWLGTTMINSRTINALGQRIDGLRSEMRAGFAGVNERLGHLETRFDRIEDEVRKDHESRLPRLEARVFSRTA